MNGRDLVSRAGVSATILVIGFAGLLLARHLVAFVARSNSAGANVNVATVGMGAFVFASIVSAWHRPFRSPEEWLKAALTSSVGAAGVAWLAATVPDIGRTESVPMSLLGVCLWGLGTALLLGVTVGAVEGTLLGLVARVGSAEQNAPRRKVSFLVGLSILSGIHIALCVVALGPT